MSISRRIALATALLLGTVVVRAAEGERTFTVAVIPDTQNYVDFTQQKKTGFALDASELFIDQLDYIASRSAEMGGDIVFAASVGDVWQHIFTTEDAEHTKRGIVPTGNNQSFAQLVRPQETRDIEIPKAVEGYLLLSQAGIPFGVAPGNHDYDAWWSVKPAGSDTTQVHIGGLDNFRRVFGNSSDFFRGKRWYVSSYNGGTSSAQVFEAGGYRFLHLALEMQPGDDVLSWATTVLRAYAGLPTLISTHDYLSPRGERKPSTGVDLALGDPKGNNSAEQLWQKFIRRNDQILMVLSGHQLGQATRIDRNAAGHKVYQMLADYQGRGQVGLDAGQPLGRNNQPAGIGDGWFRELTFTLGGSKPHVDVKTYSTHYSVYAEQAAKYATWYRQQEQPGMSDAEFVKADSFTLDLDDFVARFGPPKTRQSR